MGNSNATTGRRESPTSVGLVVGAIVAVLVIIGLFVLGFSIRHEVEENEQMLHRLLHRTEKRPDSRCNDNNPCTQDASQVAYQTCVYDPVPNGSPCASQCLVPDATSGVCVAGDCLSERSDCLGDCDADVISDPCFEYPYDSNDPTCLEEIGCPPLPLGVPLNANVLPYNADPRVAYCALHSCRYLVVLSTPELNSFPFDGAPQEACNELLNTSVASVAEGCWDSVRVDYTDQSNLFFFGLGSFSTCTFFMHCAPYDTVSPVELLSAKVESVKQGEQAMLAQLAATASQNKGG